MTLKRSWVESANNANTQFPLNNLPYGVFSTADKDARCGVAIGDHVLDLKGLESEGVIAFDGVFKSTNWNSFMALGQTQWKALRARIMELLAEASNQRDVVEKHLVDLENAQLHLPISVTEFTDFYAGKNHATNVGTMFRGAENALPPNWLHIPIGYNGRASSVVISGTDIRRPWGQLKGPDDATPRWAPSQRFDIELEMGAIIGAPSNGPISVNQADANIFGYVMLNDWSARDIQAWEYQPLGPFQAKATATTISPWIVSPTALEPFRCFTPAREKDLLPHLRDTGPMLFDIDLLVTLNDMTICETNYREMYYSAAQQLAHHTTSGCPMRVGDLIGSGTISGAEKHQRGSLLELSWGGKEPFILPNGETRSFVNDGDVLEFHGAAKGNGYQIGFGSCSGKLLPALDDPFQR